MVRVGFSSLCLLLALSTPALAQQADVPPAKDPIAFAETLKQAKFAGFVATGDRERAAGRLGAAANAYADALELYRDPIISGRLGVILVQIGRPTDAADLLIDALERGTKTTSEERDAFRKSYDLAREQVCRVDVQVTEAHAKILLDGRVKEMEDLTGFTLFLAPGEHELRAVLKGFNDAIVNFQAPKGGDMAVTLTLEKVSPLLESPDKLLRKGARQPTVTNLDEPPEDEGEKHEPIRGGVVGDQKSTGMRKTISAGPVVVFGVASWSPAVGAVLAGSLRPNEYVSLGLEARAAWLTTGVGGEPINAMTAGGILNVCGHWRWLFGCGLAHLGIFRGSFSSDSYTGQTFTDFKPGGGARAGVLVHPAGSFLIQGAVDVLGLSRGTKVVVGQTLLIEQPPLLIGVQLAGGWEF